MIAPPDPRWRLLVGHFFRSLFRLSFLDAAGEESFRRAIFAVLSGIIAVGLFFPRFFLTKYGGLSRSPTAELYLLMAPADQILMISLSMCAVGLVSALVMSSIFPDDTDFRTLMALPLSRQTIFSAKCAAVFLFAGLFSMISCVFFGVPFTLVSHGRWATHPLGARMLAHLIASLAACTCTVLTVIGIQGVVVATASRRWLQQLSVIVQTVMICGVVLSLPFVSRAPTLGPAIANRSRWLLAAPPAWFLGLQEWLLGNRMAFFGDLMVVAAGATLGAAIVTTVCYAVAYARFDQTVLRPVHTAFSATRTRGARRTDRHHPCYEAIRRFMTLTLLRSGLHQLVFGALFAASLALALNRLLASSPNTAIRWSQAAIITAPITLMAGATVGLRMAFLLPTNLRASWIFRMTEDTETRRHQLDAVRWGLFVWGVGIPAVLAALLYVPIFGLRAGVAGLTIVLLLGWILTEMFSMGWRRIPFTCTFLFAKRPPAYTILLALLIFGWFVFFGWAFVSAAQHGPRPWLVLLAVLGLIGIGLSRYRHTTWGRLPLEFEDYMPDEVSPLRLGP